MTTMLTAAFALQWLAIVTMALLMVGLFRQVGMLHERLGPVGALSMGGGVAVGEPAPSFDLLDLDGGQVRIGGASPDGRSTLLFFLSPTCPICKSMLPIVRNVTRQDRSGTRLILASDGDEPLQRKMVASEGLASLSLVLSMDLGRAFGVSKLPYAVLLDDRGNVAGKGLVNNREHLESLFEARDTGVRSIQDHLSRTHAVA